MSRGRNSVRGICTSLVSFPVPVLPIRRRPCLKPVPPHISRQIIVTDLPACLLTEGDGEISFCGAIEIAGIITLKFDVIKNGQANLGMVNGKSPIFLPGPVQPQFGPGRMLYFVRTKRPCPCSGQLLINHPRRASPWTSTASSTTWTPPLLIARAASE